MLPMPRPLLAILAVLIFVYLAYGLSVPGQSPWSEIQVTSPKQDLLPLSPYNGRLLPQSRVPRLQGRANDPPLDSARRVQILALKRASLDRPRPRSFGDIKKDISLQRQWWPAMPNGRAVIALFNRILSIPSLEITNVVCLGLGSLRTSATTVRSSEQLAALEIMLEILRMTIIC